MSSEYWDDQWAKKVTTFENIDDFLSYQSKITKGGYTDLYNLIEQENIKGKKVLDIGGAYGYILNLFFDTSNKKHLFDTSNTAIDISKKLYQFEEAKVINVLSGDLSNYKGCFDAIICSEVIEHIHPEETALFLENIKYLLADDGSLFLTTPNISSLSSRIKFLFGMLPNFYTMEKTHITPFRVKDMSLHLEKIGFVIDNIFTSKALIPIARGNYKQLPFRFNLGEKIIVKCSK